MCTYRFRSPHTSTPPPTTTATSLHKLLRSCSLGRLEQSEGTVGASQLHLPGSLGLTGGCVPYQDPVYSQPPRLPGTHFHNAAWSPARKLIPLCRRCSAMLSALHCAHFAFCVCCFSLLFPSVSPASHLQILPLVPHLPCVFQSSVLVLQVQLPVCASQCSSRVLPLVCVPAWF